jgi:hypothetical protein
MMLVFYLECGFSLLPNRKSFARGTPFLLRDVKECQYFFINDLVHLNPTLTQVERVLPKRSSQRVCCLILTAHPVARFFIEYGQRAIVCGLRVFVRIADRAVFSRSAKILLQNGAILRNTLRMLNLQTPSVGNAVQRSENIGNSLGLNYKSAALPTELCRRCPYESRFSEFIKSSSDDSPCITNNRYALHK